MFPLNKVGNLITYATRYPEIWEKSISSRITGRQIPAQPWLLYTRIVIIFFLRLSNTDPEDTYRWSWQDDASPGNSFSSDHSGLETTLNYTVSYPSAEV